MNVSTEKSCLCNLFLIQDVMARINDIFDAFGGATRLAEAIGISPIHAQTMKTRRSIPTAYWPALVKAAKKKAIPGITLEKLLDLHIQKKIAP